MTQPIQEWYGIGMTMALLKAYPFVIAAIVTLDLLWLGVLMKGFYQTRLGHLLSDTVVWPAAIVFYLVFAVGILVFAVLPGLSADSLARTLMLGALFGVVAYATYDLTNHATLKNWPMVVTVVDIAWGAALSALAAGVGWATASFFTQ